MSDESTARMPCPLDHKHTCFVKELENHLKKCNSREKEKPIYYQKNVNSKKLEESIEKITISKISDDELMNLIAKIKRTYNEYLLPLETEEISHPIVQTALNDNKNGQVAIKHLRQQASLLGHMKNLNLLSNETCFVEFGAGRGQLTFWIIQAVDDKTSCKFILIDRASQRHKFDTKLKHDKDLHIERIRLDIKHLYLGRVPTISCHKGNIVGVTKHLCGAATDLALKCLMETLHDQKNQSCNYLLQGIVMALCCHHQCTWQTYVGRAFLEEQQYNQREFHLLCGLASWATCGRMPEHFNSNDSTSNMDNNNYEKNRYKKINLDVDFREEIGRQCKRILDYGRIHYLQQYKFDAKLIHYVDPTVSLENVAIVAKNKNLQ